MRVFVYGAGVLGCELMHRLAAPSYRKLKAAMPPWEALKEIYF